MLFCRYVTALHNQLLAFRGKKEIDKRLNHIGLIGRVVIIQLTDDGINVATPHVHVRINKVFAVV